MENRRSDAMHAVLRDRIAKTSGGATQLREMANLFDMTYGLPLGPKHLALQYLIGLDVLPLSRTMTLVGPPGSGKSVMGWYLSTLFAENDGFVTFVDAENKTSWDQVEGIYRAKDLAAKDWFMRLHPTTQQQMFEHTTLFGQQMTQLIAPECKPKTKQKNPVHGAPVMYFVDSISYLASAAQVKKRIEENEQGSAVGFAGAHKANNLSEHLATLTPHYVDSWPALYVAINHQKEKLDEEGSGGYGKKTQEAGGAHKEFMYSLNIEIMRANGIANHILGTKRQGMTLKTQKSCFSDHGRQIGLLMCTTQAEEGGIVVDFEWGRAIVDLLGAGSKGWGKKGHCPVDTGMLAPFLTVEREAATKCSCKELDMKDVSPEELGMAIIDRCAPDDVFYKGIQKALWVERKRVHVPSKWVAPDDGKMKIDDARALMPLSTDKKAPAPKKKKAPAKKAAASSAPAVKDARSMMPLADTKQPVADVVEAPVIPVAPTEVQHAEIPMETLPEPPAAPQASRPPSRRRGKP